MINYSAGVCPACKSDNIYYTKNEHTLYEDKLVMHAICNDCKTCFNEILKIDFVKAEITGKAIPEEEL